jgi:hypothetical protein
MSDKLPGDGLFGWLGRQVGYVKKAVKTKPNALPAPKRSAPHTASPAPEAGASTGAGGAPPVLYRHGQVQEAEHPTQPGLKLRRTVIDEVIADPQSRQEPTEPPGGNSGG